jgi:hypothetical protein
MIRAFESPKMPCTVGRGRKPGNAYASHSRRFRFVGLAIETSCANSSPLQPLEISRWRQFSAPISLKTTHTTFTMNLQSQLQVAPWI